MKDVLIQVLTPIFAAIGLAIATQIGLILQRVFKRLGVQLTVDQETAISQTTRREVLAAAEWGANKAGTTGAEKLAKVQAAVAAKFPKLAPEEMDAHIHAEVAALGVGAATVPATLPLPAVEVKS